MALQHKFNSKNGYPRPPFRLWAVLFVILYSLQLQAQQKPTAVVLLNNLGQGNQIEVGNEILSAAENALMCHFDILDRRHLSQKYPDFMMGNEVEAELKKIYPILLRANVLVKIEISYDNFHRDGRVSLRCTSLSCGLLVLRNTYFTLTGADIQNRTIQKRIQEELPPCNTTLPDCPREEELEQPKIKEGANITPPPPITQPKPEPKKDKFKELGIEMISIPGKNYKIAKYETTIGQYLAFCKATNSHYPIWLEEGNEYNIHTGKEKDYYKKRGMSEENTNYPITGISAIDADAFCKWLGGRLPTEEEWEYAAKGGKNYTYAGSNDIDAVAWYADNSGAKAHPVGQKKSNGYGLYDMSGNVWEWTSSNYEGGTNRVLRGGSWNYNFIICTLAYRSFNRPTSGNSDSGFRLCLLPF